MQPVKQSLMMVAAMLLVVSLAEAQTADAAYLSGRVKELPPKKLGKLDISNTQALQFTWEKGGWKVPFARIKTVYVSLSRRSVLHEAFGLTGAAIGESKKRKLLLSLMLSDEQGKNRNCVFFLPGAPPAEFWRVMEEKTGRKIVFESEEARQAAEALE